MDCLQAWQWIARLKNKKDRHNQLSSLSKFAVRGCFSHARSISPRISFHAPGEGCSNLHTEKEGVQRKHGSVCKNYCTLISKAHKPASIIIFHTRLAAAIS